ncbi:uncharacterized protein HGUI_04002 [Hanseniaspora guilliermondii]|uniref:Uncharacterized protein n=1 Tax=Hanseniaspora guilliermondii TaxID=56406 RepID=A0A1L0CT92_9ASCO|nr:uncharacterized protein HGUI_04002 [Hanseniaspora guilliermondii]
MQISTFILIVWFFDFNFCLPLNKLLNGQHKICTNNYADGQVSIRSTIRQLLGIPKHHFLSKQINKWIIPTEYTGFKIMKRHSLKNGMSNIFSDITLNYCQEGELIWSKSINNFETPDKNKILWSEPICTYYDDEDSTTYNSDSVYYNKTSLWNRIAKWTLEKTKIKTKTKVDKISLKERALRNPDKLRCYKAARNKKYALQNLTIFLPNQFIGGIFKCDLAQNQTLIDNFMDDSLNWKRNENLTSDILSNLCTVNNSKPLLPLIGDKFENYWSEYNGLKKDNNKFHISIIKTLPFLYTPHILDSTAHSPTNSTNKNDLVIKDSDSVEWTHTLRYRLLDKLRTKSKDKTSNYWYNEISVDESYTFELKEMKNLEKATNLFLKKLQKITDSNYFQEKNIIEEMQLDDNINGKSISTKKAVKHFPKKILFSALTFEEKLTNLLAEKLLSKSIKNLIQENDKLQFKNEHFNYDEL